MTRGFAIHILLGQERPPVAVPAGTENEEKRLRGWLLENPDLLALVEQASALAFPDGALPRRDPR